MPISDSKKVLVFLIIVDYPVGIVLGADADRPRL
jgi:hypothetical protein